MAVTFQHKIVLRPGSVFCFGTISSVAYEEGTLHRIADPPKRKSSSKISKKIEAKQGKAQPPELREKITFSKLGAEGPSTRRTPLSTSLTEKWTRITRKKEANEAKDHQAALSVPPSSKESREKTVVTTVPFYPDILFIRIRPARMALSISRWALRVAEVSSATLTANRAASSSWTTDLLEARKSLMIHQLPKANHIIQGLLQLITMIIQVFHGETMAPLQDGQRVAGVAVQLVKVVARSGKSTFFLLQTRISFSNVKQALRTQ
jgi:hypothetical protein